MTTDSGTYDQSTLARKQAMAQALLGNALKPEENVKHWAQGLANLAKAGIGGYMGYQANQEAKDEKAKGQADLYTALGLPAPAAPAESPGMFSKIGALLSGGGAADAPPVAAPISPGGDQASYPPPAAPAPAPTTFRPGITASAPEGAPDYGKAIAGIESGGAYDKLGPQTKTGDRAFGKYQVMGNNIPEWTTQVLGKPMTPEQFLANPDAQEAVFKAKFGDYVQKYGPEGAAKAWFAGEKGMNNPNAKDVLGTSVAGYGQKFTNALGPQVPPEITGGQSAAPQIASALAAPAGAPTAPPVGPAGVLAGMPQDTKLQIARLLSSNNPTAKAMGTALLQNAISDKVTYQTTPDGDILAMDPHGRAPPKVVYKAGAKPIAVPENSQLYDPATKSFIGGGPAAIPTSVPGPDGKPIPIPPGLSSKDAKEFTKHVTQSTADAATGKMTEVQGNAQQFANRMEAAQSAITPDIEKEALGLSGAAQQIAGKVPVVGAALQSEAYQKYAQAKSQFITAVLRKESGAAISHEEFNRYDKEFFPQPGDKPGAVAQKAKEREVALDAMRRVAGPSYKPADITKPTAAPVTKSIGGKEYYQENGQWFEK
jgi:hypothetical protein